MIDINNYTKTAPIDLERFKQLAEQLPNSEGTERQAIASELIDLLKKESWRIVGELITSSNEQASTRKASLIHQLEPPPQGRIQS